MSTVQTWQTESTSLDDTLKLAALVGRKLRGGEIIELVSDLGGGKTSFVKGLAKGAGSDDTVHSPSFTINNSYNAGEITIQHFDFYRLDEPGIMKQELSELLDDTKAVVIVEWGDMVENVLPSERLIIRLQTLGENARRLQFKYPASLNYLIPNNT